MEFLEILKDNATDYSFVPSSGIRKPQKNLQTQLHLDLNFAQLKDFFQQYLLIFWRNKVFKPFHNVDLVQQKSPEQNIGTDCQSNLSPNHYCPHKYQIRRQESNKIVTWWDCSGAPAALTASPPGLRPLLSLGGSVAIHQLPSQWGGDPDCTMHSTWTQAQETSTPPFAVFHAWPSHWPDCAMLKQGRHRLLHMYSA